MSRWSPLHVRAMFVPFFLILSGTATAWAAGSVAAPTVEWVPGELVVKLRETRSIQSGGHPDGVANLDAELGIAGRERLSAGTNWFRVRLGAHQDVPAAAARYRALPEVDAAEPNYIFRLVGEPATLSTTRAPVIRASFTPNDPSFPNQWGLTHIQAAQAWDITQGSPSQIIAVIDTGADLDHPDLAGKIWANPVEVPGDRNGDNCPGVCGTDDDGDGLVDEDGSGRQPSAGGYDVAFRADDDENGFIDDFRGWDFIGTSGVPDNHPQDDNGHGTHCAGIAAAATNNGIGIAGVCPQCRIMPLKAFESAGTAASSDIAKAIDYAQRNGATVISMSFSSPADSALVRDALSNAYPKATLVAAAGNDRRSRSVALCEATGNEYPIQPSFPAHYANVIGVEAIDPTGAFASFSNCGYSIKAPGVGIESTVLNDTYTSWAGTSMAAPFVAGTAGLLRALKAGDPAWNSALIYGQLVRSGGNAHQALTLGPQPRLVFETLQVLDTIGTCLSCDGDGVADAGETVRLIVTVRNEWANATGVTGTITSSNPAVTIPQGSSNWGAVGPSATDNNADNPFQITIASSATHNLDLGLNLTVTAANGGTGINQALPMRIQRGLTKGGTISANETWVADNVYLVADNLLIQTGVRLTIAPGTTVRFSPGKGMTVQGELVARGTPQNRITFEGDQPSSGWGGIILVPETTPTVFDANGAYVSGSIFEYCLFRHSSGVAFNAATAALHPDEAYVGRNIFTQNSAPTSLRIFFAPAGIIEKNLFTENQGSVAESTQGHFRQNTMVGNGAGLSLPGTPGIIRLNNLFGNTGADLRLAPSSSDTPAADNYWGTTDPASIAARIHDFSDDSALGVVTFQPILTAPPVDAPPVVRSITIDPPSPVGAQRVTFTITFSKPMDMRFPPKITFGAASPFTTRTINLNPRWVGGVDVVVNTPGGTATIPGGFTYLLPGSAGKIGAAATEGEPER